MYFETIESSIYCPSLRRAEKLVPPEFLIGYKWFKDHEGEHLERLPFADTLSEPLPITLVRQSGIHSPSENMATYKDPRHHYALSVHTSKQSRYADQPIFKLDDNTWILDYEGHSGADLSQNYNKLLDNCLRDGVPVGVITAEAGEGYCVRGLAFVESHDILTNRFILHGPVNAITEAAHRFDYPDVSGIDQSDLASLRNAADPAEEPDQRIRETIEHIRREGQQKFRSSLIDAYEGECAATGTNVQEVLQAAHIVPYRGSCSQIESNGILFRADIHLLYDSHLLSVEPDTHRIRLSKKIVNSSYSALRNRKIRIPKDNALRPDDHRLALHFQRFSFENREIGFA